MKFINFGKLLEEAKKKDPNIDESRVFAKLAMGIVEQKNAYRGSRALTESEVPEGLEKAVREYFSTHKHKSHNESFELARLERSNIDESDIYAVPKSIYESLDIDDDEFDNGLAEIGKRFSVSIRLPWYCYAK